MCKHPSSKTSMGTTQMEKTDNIYSPQKRGTPHPPIPATTECPPWGREVRGRGRVCMLGATVRLEQQGNRGYGCNGQSTEGNSLSLNFSI